MSANRRRTDAATLCCPVTWEERAVVDELKRWLPPRLASDANVVREALLRMAARAGVTRLGPHDFEPRVLGTQAPVRLPASRRATG